MFEYDEDVSRIIPEDVKTESEGKGKFYAALGKEIDEHNILKKQESRKKLTVILIFIGFIAILIGCTAIPMFHIKFTFNEAVKHKNEEYITEYKDSSNKIWEYKPID